MKNNQKSQEKEPQEIRKSLSYFILNYIFHHKNIPFDYKTLMFAIRQDSFKKHYFNTELCRLHRLKFIDEPTSGIFMMTEKNFSIIQNNRPILAKQIMLKFNHEKEL